MWRYVSLRSLEPEQAIHIIKASHLPLEVGLPACYYAPGLLFALFYPFSVRALMGEGGVDWSAMLIPPRG